MAYSQRLVQEGRSLLGQKLELAVFEEEIEEKKMFGGLAFMVRGKMSACISGIVGVKVMVRIGKDLQQKVMPRQGAKVAMMKGRPYRGYVDLDHEGQKELSYWLDLALAYNNELTSKK